MIANKLIKWKYQDKTIATFTVSVDESEINDRVKSAIIDALNNKPNPVLQINWSEFGKNGDCIEIEDIVIGGELK